MACSGSKILLNNFVILSEVRVYALPFWSNGTAMSFEVLFSRKSLRCFFLRYTTIKMSEIIIRAKMDNAITVLFGFDSISMMIAQSLMVM